jgi:hypothetical protein
MAKINKRPIVIQDLIEQATYIAVEIALKLSFI